MPGNPLNDPNWANDITDQLIATIGKVRDKTTDNAIKVVRGVVFGLLLTLLALVAVVLMMIMLTRSIQLLFDIFISTERSVYASYLSIGLLFVAVGTLAMRRRTSS